MVAACPVYAQTNKEDSHAENEHYASADYHYVSNRGIKVWNYMTVHKINKIAQTFAGIELKLMQNM